MGFRKSLWVSKSLLRETTCFCNASNWVSSSCVLDTVEGIGGFHSLMNVRSVRPIVPGSGQLRFLCRLLPLRMLNESDGSAASSSCILDDNVTGSSTRFHPYSMFETPPDSGSLLCRAAQ